MDTIGKFRKNFLGKGRSFKIGFNNRSPFSYISTTGPEVPSRFDGGVALHMFTPDDYAKAFDTSDAVRAEHEMYKKAGEATGKVVGAIGSAVAGGIEAGKEGGSFGDIMKGAGEGFTDYEGLLGDNAKKGVDSGMGDIRISGGGGGGGMNDIRKNNNNNNTNQNKKPTYKPTGNKVADQIFDCQMNQGGKWNPDTGTCEK